jgi:hypothetical protein
MSLVYMLLAGQAVGYAASIYGKKQEERYTRAGEQLDRQERQLQMEQEQLASQEQSLYSSERLREVMSSQRALAAARGVQSGQGSNMALAQRDIRTYNADERARQLSMSFRKHQMDSYNRLYSLNQAGRNVGRRADRFVQGMNLLNYNPLTEKLFDNIKLNK